MAREYSEDTAIRVALNAIEDETTSTLLTQFMVDYCLPARIVAGCAGVSVQTLYQHLDADESVRLTRQVEPKLVKMVEHLKTLAAEGKLDVCGTASERNAQLVDLLAIADPEQ